MVEKCPIWIIGCGEHARVIRDAIPEQYHFAGFIISHEEKAEQSIGEEEFLEKILTPTRVIIGIGDNYLRDQVFQRLSVQRFVKWETIVHPSSTISRHAALGPGTFVSAGAIINTGARIGKNVIINTGAIIEHDCVVEDSASVAPRACLGGGAQIGARSAVSIGATIRHGISIGADTVIGAGAVVLRDIPDGVVAHGIPANIRRKRTPSEKYL